MKEAEKSLNPLPVSQTGRQGEMTIINVKNEKDERIKSKEGFFKTSSNFTLSVG